jgi:predicted nucleotidyltransferase
MSDAYFNSLIDELSNLEAVEGILLSGSRAGQLYDESSDYDVYVYINQEIDVTIRKKITMNYCTYMDLDNRYWEIEDDGQLKSGIDIELIYRNIESIDCILENVVFNHQANIGYSTCFWANVLQSKVLYDKNGRLQSLLDKYSVPYPPVLKQNIVERNYPLLKHKPFSYYHQIEKAIIRHDLVSINHRITEFLASYFDILFAINELPHPGEKRMKAYVLKECELIPEGFSNHLDQLLQSIADNHKHALTCIHLMVNNLSDILIKHNLLPHLI